MSLKDDRGDVFMRSDEPIRGAGSIEALGFVSTGCANEGLRQQNNPKGDRAGVRAIDP